MFSGETCLSVTNICLILENSLPLKLMFFTNPSNEQKGISADIGRELVMKAPRWFLKRI